MTAARAFPAARLPADVDAPPPAEELAASFRARALAAAAESGILLAAARSRELTSQVEKLLERTLGKNNPPGLTQAIVRAVEVVAPPALGPIVFCDVCSQVGRAVELWGGKVRWVWSGQDATGAVVHVARVVQMRELGDMPPRRCPDHEDPERLRPRGACFELERSRPRV